MVNRDKQFIKTYLKEKGIKNIKAQKYYGFNYNEVLSLMEYAHESERMIEVECDGCNKTLLIHEDNKHKIIVCPKCKYENKYVWGLGTLY